MNKGATVPQHRARESISANEKRHGLRRGVCTTAEVGVRGLLEALSCPAPVVQLEVTVDTACFGAEHSMSAQRWQEMREDSCFACVLGG